VFPVYEKWGPPFRRWLRWKPSHPAVDDDVAVRAILTNLELCKVRDDIACGVSGGGAWVAVLGFSQGAKIAASLLYDQQVAGQTGGYRFGILMAGRGPLVALREEALEDAALMSPGAMSLQRYDSPHASAHVLRLPTVHVHGLRDEGLAWHRKLAEQYCDPETIKVLEWDGSHRVPVKADAVGRIASEIYAMARECGVEIQV